MDGVVSCCVRPDDSGLFRLGSTGRAGISGDGWDRDQVFGRGEESDSRGV